MNAISRIVLTLLGSMICLTSAAAAQAVIRSSVIGSGATTAMGSGLVAGATVGQHGIGIGQSLDGTARIGFWYTLPQRTTNSVPAEPIAMDDRITMSVMPNPFVGRSLLRLAVSPGKQTTLKLYDAVGREVRTLFDGVCETGRLEIVLDGESLDTGEYVAHLLSGTAWCAVRLIVLR